MASKLIMPNPTMNNNINIHSAFSGDISLRSCSFGQVSLPNEIASSSSSVKTSSTSKRSIKTASFSLLPKLVATAFSRSTSINTNLLPHLWREIHGSNNWENLIEPLSPLLRQEIIRYGEFVNACYKAFDLNPNSKRYLNCKYGKKTVLKEVGLGDSGYVVTKYIYATPDVSIPIQNASSSSCGRWIGYVAVSSDDEAKKLGRRDITVTFRGTVTNPEWIANFMSSLTPARLDPHNPRPEVKVESGFLSLYTSDESTTTKFGLESCREQLLSEITRLINTYKGEEISISIAGHSMGSSLGLLLAYDIAELGLNINKNNRSRTIPLTVFSFAGPRVGNAAFKERCEELGVKVLRIVNVNDPITKLPGVVFNENFRVLMGGKYEFPWSCSCYAHVGVELALDFFEMQNFSCVHDLETYIDLLRCPRKASSSSVDHHQVQYGWEGVDFLNRARDQLLSCAQNFDMSPWRNAASNMVNLVQTQRT